MTAMKSSIEEMGWGREWNLIVKLVFILLWKQYVNDFIASIAANQSFGQPEKVSSHVILIPY